MGLFGKKDAQPKINEGGLMDSIRCDETDYLIWKWRPKGEDVNTTKKENAIRWGSIIVLSVICTIIHLVINLIATIAPFHVAPYIIFSGIVLLSYVGIVYGMSKAI